MTLTVMVLDERSSREWLSKSGRRFSRACKVGRPFYESRYVKLGDDLELRTACGTSYTFSEHDRVVFYRGDGGILHEEHFYLIGKEIGKEVCLEFEVTKANDEIVITVKLADPVVCQSLV